jgi:hypothetical protein
VAAILIEKDKESRFVPLFTELFSGDRSTKMIPLQASIVHGKPELVLSASKYPTGHLSQLHLWQYPLLLRLLVPHFF